jgi:hypothetical protein
MGTIFVVWIAWALFLWYLIRGPATAFRALMAAGLVMGWSAVALADPAAGGTSSDPSLGTTLQNWTVVLVGAAVTSALGWLAPRVKHYLGARAAQAVLDQRRGLAKEAIGYVDQMEHLAGHVLSESEIAKHVGEFFAQHAIAGDAASAVRSFIESELGTRRATATAVNRLANAAQNLQEAMATGQLGKDIATIERQQDAAIAAAKLPPTPPVGIVKP